MCGSIAWAGDKKCDANPSAWLQTAPFSFDIFKPKKAFLPHFIHQISHDLRSAFTNMFLF